MLRQAQHDNPEGGRRDRTDGTNGTDQGREAENGKTTGGRRPPLQWEKLTESSDKLRYRGGIVRARRGVEDVVGSRGRWEMREER